MKTILVTGGAGFIGSNFVRHVFNQESVRIINLDKLTYAGNLHSLADLMDMPGHVFIHGSIEDRSLVDSLLSAYKPDAIVNFAAETHVDRSIDGPSNFIQTNMVGTFQLLEASRAYWNRLPEENKAQFRFVHISTDEVYGSLGPTGLFTETTPYAPNSPYSASKASSDHLVRAYYHTYGLPVLTTNCSNNYGPYQFPEKLIPLMITNAVRNRMLPIYGDGKNIRDWLFVIDHCKAVQAVLERGRPGEVYNIGGNNEKTNLEIVYKICGILDDLHPRSDGCSYRGQIVFVRDRPGHDRRYAIDSAKISEELGWKPDETFETGLYMTVKWYLDNFIWCNSIFEGSYQSIRLGLNITA